MLAPAPATPAEYRPGEVVWSSDVPRGGPGAGLFVVLFGVVRQEYAPPTGSGAPADSQLRVSPARGQGWKGCRGDGSSVGAVLRPLSAHHALGPPRASANLSPFRLRLLAAESCACPTPPATRNLQQQRCGHPMRHPLQGVGSILGDLAALFDGSPLPGHEGVTACGNSFGRGPLVCHFPAAALQLLRDRCEGRARRGGRGPCGATAATWLKRPSCQRSSRVPRLRLATLQGRGR